MIALYWLWMGFALCTGLILGSFSNVAIGRWAVDKSVVAPRSHCPYCGTTLGPSELVPVLSWLWLRGKCGTCSSPIAPTYPLIELLGGLLGLLVYRRVIPNAASVDAAHLTAWAVLTVFVILLVIAAYVDLRHWIIPDQTSVYAIPFAVLSVVVLQFMDYDGWMAITWQTSVIGALVGAGALAAVSMVTRFIYGYQALGWGDVKLMGFIGAMVGPLPVIFVVFLVGSIIGSVVGLAYLLVRRRNGMLPFGPSLVLAAILYVLYGDVLTRVLVPGVGLALGWT